MGLRGHWSAPWVPAGVRACSPVCLQDHPSQNLRVGGDPTGVQPARLALRPFCFLGQNSCIPLIDPLCQREPGCPHLSAASLL